MGNVLIREGLQSRNGRSALVIKQPVETTTLPGWGIEQPESEGKA